MLVAMAVIVGVVGITYRAQRRALRSQAPPTPQALPLDLNSSATDWHFTQTDNKTNRVIADIRAGDFRQVKDSSRVDLRNVTLKLPSKEGGTYDLVRSAAATYFSDQHRLYSDGEVEITLGVPDAGEPAHRLISIQSSGVTFDTDTGKAETDRPSRFTFQYGEGNSSGASYDPTARTLLMNKDVEVDWRPPGPHAPPMKIQAASLTYQEAQSQILLPDWGKMTRAGTIVEGYRSVIHLRDGALQQITSTRAHGTETDPNRKLQYSADNLVMAFNDDAVVEKITAQGNAQMQATSENSATSVAAPWVELGFQARNNESLLSRVLTRGGSTVTSRPLPAPGRQMPETDVLRSDSVEIQMRPDGRDIQSLITHSPGRLEFLPNQPAQHHRVLDGSQITVTYGAQNRIDSFRAKNVKTETDPTEEERKRNRGIAVTSSQEMLARFETGSSRLASMEQWGDFQYQEGDRRARAAKATLDSAQNVMLLDTGARVWDASGSTEADGIRLDQRTGDFTAQGHVNSTRLPDQKQNNGMLSGDEPIQAQARKMDSTNRNRTIHYEGDARLWQGANRIQADVVDVDREKQRLTADGSVVTDLWEQPKDEHPGGAGSAQPGAAAKVQPTGTAKPGPPGSGTPGAPVLTVVHAAHLVYTDQDRQALYTGGVVLERAALQVKARQLRAYLSQAGSDSRLEKAFAEGSVQIVQRAPDRMRTGSAEHAEYYPGEQKIVLQGGDPQMVDSLKGNTHGRELTYFANDDRLLVNGSPDQPAQSRLRRK